MLSVQGSIKEHQLRLSQNDFLRRLESGVASIEIGQQFAADMTFWVMTFQDILRLNRERVQRPALREIAEQHLQEDAGHEKWFWHDAKALSVLQSPEWYFGKESARVRELSLELASEVFRAEHDETRVTLILALEATGEVFFPRVVNYFERCNWGDQLKYFAQTHREVERDHEVFESKTHELLSQVTLSAEQTKEANAVVRRVFTAFEGLGSFLEKRICDKLGSQPESRVARYVRLAGAGGLELRTGALVESFASDFGGIARAAVTAVVDARSESQVVHALELANASGVEITVRGGGNSQAGQSIPSAGLVLHVAPMKQVSVDAGARMAFCEPGATWRDLTKISLEQNLLPYVQPLNLDLTIGGTLSAGGLGSSSHKYCTAAHHVAELRAVTGAGERVAGTRENDPDLFNAVLANQGRCAVATRVGLRLRPCGDRVQTISFRYDELGDLLHDMSWLSEHEVPEHMEAFSSSSFLGMRRVGSTYVPRRRWAFTLQLSYECENQVSALQIGKALRAKEVLLEESGDQASYAARYDSRFQFMRASGAWGQAHPWLEWLLPRQQALELATFVLERLPPAYGEGHRLFHLPGGKEYPGFFAVPDGQSFVGLAVLPTGVAKENLPAAMEAARALDDHLSQRGAKRYLSGWLGRPDLAFWRQHYGEGFQTWQTAKERWDPKRVLQSQLFRVASDESAT